LLTTLPLAAVFYAKVNTVFIYFSTLSNTEVMILCAIVKLDIESIDYNENIKKISITITVIEKLFDIEI